MMHRSVRKIVLLFVNYDVDTVIFAAQIQNKHARNTLSEHEINPLQ